MESVRLVVNRCAKLWNTKLENCTRVKRQIQGGTHVKYEAYLRHSRSLIIDNIYLSLKKKQIRLNESENVLVLAVSNYFTYPGKHIGLLCL